MKFISTFLFLISFQFSFAQTYHAFPDSNARWSEESYGSWTENGTGNLIKEYIGWLYALGNDTIINSVKYTLLGRQEPWSYTIYKGKTSGGNQSLDLPGQVIGGIREDSNKKVWFINLYEYTIFCHNYYGGSVCTSYWQDVNPPVDSEILLYDFDLHVGETITCPFQRVVSSIDSIQLQDGSYRKRFVFSPASDFWIEGIGSSLGLFGLYNFPYVSNYSSGCFGLNCFWQDGQYLFEKSPFPTGITCDSLNISALMGIPPAYSSSGILVSSLGIIQLAADSDAMNLRVTNSLGQIIFQSDVQSSLVDLDISNYPSGLYYVIINSSQNKITLTKVVKI